MRSHFILIFMLGMLIIGCKNKTTENPCIKNIIAQDELLGKVRNNICKTQSLSKAISDYTQGMRHLILVGCPQEFNDAFETHIVAWENMIPIADKYPEERGEMHDIFDRIKAKSDKDFDDQLQSIWDSWAQVEKQFK